MLLKNSEGEGEEKKKKKRGVGGGGVTLTSSQKDCGALWVERERSNSQSTTKILSLRQAETENGYY